MSAKLNSLSQLSNTVDFGLEGLELVLVEIIPAETVAAHEEYFRLRDQAFNLKSDAKNLSSKATYYLDLAKMFSAKVDEGVQIACDVPATKQRLALAEARGLKQQFKNSIRNYIHDQVAKDSAYALDAADLPDFRAVNTGKESLADMYLYLGHTAKADAVKANMNADQLFMDADEVLIAAGLDAIITERKAKEKSNKKGGHK